MSGRTTGTALGLLAVAGAAVAVASASSPEPEPPPAPLLPAPAAPAFRIPAPRALQPSRHISRWAPVRTPVLARTRPARDARPAARVRARTPEGTTNIVQVLGPARRRGDGLWVRARLSALPNGTTGWIPRRALGGYSEVRTRLVVNRSRLRATLLRDGRPVLTARVGIGTAEHPTPGGRFYIRNRVTSYRSPSYGPLAFGTSARSAVLTDWPAGGYVGIHGTDRPDLLPGRVSHGCIRMRNADVLRLGKLMPVGTPVTVL